MDPCKPIAGNPNTEPEADDILLHGILLHGNQQIVRSEQLLHGKRELIILHGSQIYRLMETRNGKLILQK